MIAPSRTVTVLSRLRGATRGTAAIEFAIIVPMLLILLFGAAEVGFSVYQAMQVQDAAEAGAAYVVEHGWGSAGITAAVTNATGLSGVTASPAPSQFCGCPSISGVVTAVCTATCTGGHPVSHYVAINVALTRQSIMPLSGLALPTTLTGQSIVRVQ